MIKYDYNYPDYLIQKIEISDNTNLLPHKQEFRSALHQIYFSNNSGKINEIVNSLTAYYCRHEKLVHQEAFKKALKDLNDYSEGS
ncbi:MAG: hypothetical protein Q8Q86_01185, partial [Candidatus Daviesbacteria bacterium]|nr:hypothetical protein [Candidatus Daviesbacteria bacterium]